MKETKPQIDYTNPYSVLSAHGLAKPPLPKPPQLFDQQSPVVSKKEPEASSNQSKTTRTFTIPEKAQKTAAGAVLGILGLGAAFLPSREVHSVTHDVKTPTPLVDTKRNSGINLISISGDISTSVAKTPLSDFERLVLPENRENYMKEKNQIEWSQFTEHSVIVPKGGPTLSPEQIDYVFEVINRDLNRPEQSPAAGLGLGQFIYERCIFYNIDPSIILAFYNQESWFGTTGVAKESLSTGNIRFIPDEQLMTKEYNDKYGFDLKVGNKDGYVDYTTYTKSKKEALMMAFEHKLRLLREYYLDDVPSPKTTVESILKKYAPPSENDTDAYIASMINFSDLLRFKYGVYSKEDQSQVVPQGNPLGDFDFTITQGCHGLTSHGYKDTHGRDVCGVDLIRADGNTYRAPVYATSSGMLSLVPYPQTTYGNLATIHYFNPHANKPWDTLYGHLDQYNSSLVEGQWIEKGTLLGWIGYTGWVTPSNIQGAHLHYSFYEGYQGKNAVDPEQSLYK